VLYRNFPGLLPEFQTDLNWLNNFNAVTKKKADSYIADKRKYTIKYGWQIWNVCFVMPLLSTTTFLNGRELQQQVCKQICSLAQQSSTTSTRVLRRIRQARELKLKAHGSLPFLRQLCQVINLERLFVMWT
jgi:hypothetical protein